MASGSHSDLITINLTTQPAPVQAAGFGVLLHLVPLATNSLDGDRFRSYSGSTDVATDLAAGFISTATATELNVAFAQSPSPATVLCGYVDIAVGGESYNDGLLAVIAAGANFYAITMGGTVSDADLLEISLNVETLFSSTTPKLLFFKSDDTDWLTSGYPAALTALEGREGTIGEYHDIATESPDIAHAAAKLVWNPDVKSTPWNGAVSGVAEYTGIPTQAQKDFARANNMNIGQRFGSVNYWIDAGVTHGGRPIYEAVSAHWFAVRLDERITNTVIDLDSTGDKIAMGQVGETNSEGQAIMLSDFDAQFALGVSADHFLDGTPETEAYPITAADIAAGRLRFRGSAQYATSARLFTFDVNLYRS